MNALSSPLLSLGFCFSLMLKKISVSYSVIKTLLFSIIPYPPRPLSGRAVHKIEKSISQKNIFMQFIQKDSLGSERGQGKILLLFFNVQNGFI